MAHLLERPPKFWPRFSSPLRSPALTARIGSLLGAAFTICFITGLLSHYQYSPWSWLPEPASPVWGYRLTQGLHVITGIAAIPLLLLKLWSVYHRLWIWPGFPTLVEILERASIAVLVSASLLQLLTGLQNVLQWYPWPWGFVAVHYWLAWIIAGSLLIHIAVKLPIIQAAFAGEPTPGSIDEAESVVRTDGAAADADGAAGTPEQDDRDPDGVTRRGLLIGAGAGIGIVVVTTAGQVIPALEPVALLAPRKPSLGPQNLPVNKTAEAANVITLASSPTYQLTVAGPKPFTLSLADLEALPARRASFPISCVEGWSRGAHWRGPALLDLVRRAGGDGSSTVMVHSLERGPYDSSEITDSQLRHALLATHLNDQRLNLDHGYPLRLIAPDRAGVLQTKWITRIVIT